MTVLLGENKEEEGIRFIHRTGQDVFLSQGIQLIAYKVARRMKLAESPFIHKATSLHILSVSLWKTNRGETKILPIRY